MEVIRIESGEWSAQARELAGDGWWLADLCGVDQLGARPNGRFEIVVQLLHLDGKKRMSVHVAAAGDPPTLPSVVDVWRGADFMEREAYDMFGIHFEGHPNLTRILMPDEWEGHPLRKDYGVGKVPVEFVPQPFVQVEGPGQAPSPGESGAAVDALGQPVADSEPES